MPNWATHEAGPDLDVEVARHVLGEPIGQYESEDGPRRFIRSFGLVRDIPPFSTDIAAAWQVVEHLRDSGFLLRVVEHPESGRHVSEERRAWIEHRTECTVEQSVMGVRRRATAHGRTPALAICRAALALVGPH